MACYPFKGIGRDIESGGEKFKELLTISKIKITLG